MNSSSTLEIRNIDLSRRARYALRISAILLGAYLLSFPLYIYLGISTRQGQFYFLAGVTVVNLILSILTIRFSQRKQVEVAAALMIAGLSVQLFILIALVSGLGVIIGLTGLVGIYIITSLTLNSPESTWANITAIIVGVLIVFLDIYYPYSRLSVGLLSIYVPFAALTQIIILSFFLIREFQNYSLRVKLVISFVGIVLLSIGALGYFINRDSSTRLTQEVGEKVSAQGSTYAVIIGEILSKQISNLEAFGLSEVVQDRVDAANNSYSGTPQNIQTQIQVLDQQWRKADAANNDQDPLVAKILGEDISSELKEYRGAFNENVEVFVTDKYGALVSATNRTSDYYQADETWWQTAYNNGQGAVYISDPDFDQSSSTYGTIIAIPLYAHDTKRVIGVLHTILDINSITTTINKYRLGDTGRLELYIADGREIPPTGGVLIPGEPKALTLPTKTGSFSQILYENDLSIVSRSLVTSLDSDTAAALQKLSWSVVIHQNSDESLAPVAEQTRNITLISLLLLILAGVIAFFASIVLSQPVRALTTVAEQITSGDLKARAQINTKDEIGVLGNAFNRMTNQLQDTLGSLERRVAERTADLELARLLSERRAQELQAISEISRTISTEQRLEILLPLVARLVSERFDFYHVGIFFVDETKQFAVLHAANSEGGRKMLARGHRLELGTGIVGTVSQVGKARIALDVGSDAVFFDNPDLPETRSEMALPLNFSGETVGVLDVQSTKPGAFTESDANTLSILADQIAVAIENARLFGQTQQARDEAEALYNQFLRTEWKKFLQQNIRVGYQQSVSGGRPLNRFVETDEIRRALEEGKVIILDENLGKAHPTMAIPVKLRNETIGVLNITAPKQRRWNQDEINLAQAISDRLALALDNARLLQESQRRATKEAKISEVTAKIGASINMRNVLQTAVEELGKALPGSEVIIQFDNSQEK
jgi:GAF domain-containing protein/HAMP domain-containing protein